MHTKCICLTMKNMKVYWRSLLYSVYAKYKKLYRCKFDSCKRPKMRYPDIKDIVDHIYHDYMTRCDIIILQNQMIELLNGGIMAWCDECWLNDFAEDLKSAFDKGCFIDIDEDKVALLEKEYESTNIIELIEDYFYHNKKILRIKYHPETPDIIDPKIIKEMAEKRKALDADYRKIKGLYEKAHCS